MEPARHHAGPPRRAAGVLDADQFRMNQLLGIVDGSGGATATAANAAGSMPVHKPRSGSVPAQFTLDVRVVARVTDRVRGGPSSTAVQDITLPTPVIIRLPAPTARHLLTD
ncbi:hypothetical protein BM536_010825 [Streptomyces phaeoluteigriseus]|uniref:Uncharacterized protein n=1 Tax=Streptomyces phaeoluteigriseus TaxID=114686 RepID=A0A1V6MWD3_9ACTN|nr:hypothetical protein [Streptomyces phaeoluteigriseus]OQD56645.1 hypothetical protein BM536_010825 [Streptomyces phaeoluteigriseus]